MTRKEELISQGWEKRSTHDEPRLSEMVSAYQEIGLQVHIEPFHPDEEKDCIECMVTSPNKYATIYTRKEPEA